MELVRIMIPDRQTTRAVDFPQVAQRTCPSSLTLPSRNTQNNIQLLKTKYTPNGNYIPFCVFLEDMISRLDPPRATQRTCPSSLTPAWGPSHDWRRTVNYRVTSSVYEMRGSRSETWEVLSERIWTVEVVSHVSRHGSRASSCRWINSDGRTP